MIRFSKIFLVLIKLLIYVKSNPLVNQKQESSNAIPCGMPPEIQMVTIFFNFLFFSIFYLFLKGAAAITDSGNKIWPNGIVYYNIDSAFNGEQ